MAQAYRGNFSTEVLSHMTNSIKTVPALGTQLFNIKGFLFMENIHSMMYFSDG